MVMANMQRNYFPNYYINMKNLTIFAIAILIASQCFAKSVSSNLHASRALIDFHSANWIDHSGRLTRFHSIDSSFILLPHQIIDDSSSCTVSAICGNNSVGIGGTLQLTDSTPGGIWASSDSTIAIVNSVGNVTGISIGSTIITYTVVNSCGETTVSKNISGYDNSQPTGPLQASFFPDTSQQCMPHQFTFTNTSTVSSEISYSWDFGDGTGSTETSPIKVYSHSGIFKVHLDVKSETESAFVEKFITNQPTPQPDFTFLKGTGNGKQITFISTSTIQGGGMQYYWDLGDGHTSTLVNPVEEYADSSSYVVKLVVTSDQGCVDSISKLMPTGEVVSESDPLAIFIVNTATQCKNSNLFKFTNRSYGGIGNKASYWNFGDGTTSDSTNADKVYTLSGTYSVKLIVTDDIGVQDSTSLIVTVLPTPVVDFVIGAPASQCLNGNKFVLTNQTVNGGGLSYQWDLGDGSTSHEVNATVSYANAGTYKVTLLASNNSSCTAILSKDLIVNPSPVAGFTASANSSMYNSIIFTNTSTISNNAGLTYNWNFGDGSGSTAINPSKTYSLDGNYNVWLKVAASETGCTDSVEKLIAISAPPPPSEPVADFSYSGSGCSTGSETFLFTSQSTGGTAPYIYSWDFGDGGSATGVSSLHEYRYPNTYGVSLKVTDGLGKTATKTMTVISVAGTKPTASFTVQIITWHKDGYAYNSTSTINNGGMSYYWDLGNGQTATMSNPTAIYPSTGDYTVKLVATADSGCKDSISQVIHVAIENMAVYKPPTVVISTSANNTESKDSSQAVHVATTNTASSLPSVVVDVMPNPTTNNIIISFKPVTANNIILVKVINDKGNVVLLKRLTQLTPAGSIIRIPLNMSGLAKGYYYVTLSNEYNLRFGTTGVLKY